MAQTYKFGNGTWARKKGSTLAYSDTNNAFKPLPFSFERNSIATRVNKEGLIEVVGNDIPRIDYTDSTEGALLLENSSTNLITYSEDFSQGIWGKVSVTTQKGELDVFGNNNAYLISNTTDNSGHTLIHSTISGLNASTNHTISCFVKKGTINKIMLRDAFIGGYLAYDLENNIVLDTNSLNGQSIEDYGNGYYKISMTVLSSGSGKLRPSIYLLEDSYVSGSPTSYVGNTNENIIVTGFQLEQGSYPTSYIPTNGSTVQRAAETCNGSGNSEVFNDSQGVLFANISVLANDGEYRGFGISDGTTSNRIIFWKSYLNNTIEFGLSRNNVTQSSFSININDVKEYIKILVKYRVNDVDIWLNGFKVATDGIADMPLNLSELAFDNGNGVEFFNGNTKEIGYYDTILTDEELEYMTSYRSLNELVTELNLNTL